MYIATQAAKAVDVINLRGAPSGLAGIQYYLAANRLLCEVFKPIHDVQSKTPVHHIDVA